MECYAVRVRKKFCRVRKTVVCLFEKKFMVWALVGTGGPAPCRWAFPDRWVYFCNSAILFYWNIDSLIDWKQDFNMAGLNENNKPFNIGWNTEWLIYCQEYNYLRKENKTRIMYRFHPFFGADFFAMFPNTEFYLSYGFAFPNKNDINHQYLYWTHFQNILQFLLK